MYVHSHYYSYIGQSSVSSTGIPAAEQNNGYGPTQQALKSLVLQ